jgi:hypothetical protein
MKSKVLSFVIFFTFIIALAFAGQTQQSSGHSHLKFETLVQLPQPDVYQVSPGSDKIKFALKFILRQEHSYVHSDYHPEKCLEPLYSLPNYCLLRSKNYFLII